MTKPEVEHHVSRGRRRVPVHQETMHCLICGLKFAGPLTRESHMSMMLHIVMEHPFEFLTSEPVNTGLHKYFYRLGEMLGSKVRSMYGKKKS